ncbi:MAG: TetR/AcrR family transcriptional regulator [Myxococcales bacterium]|nr:TetR/AcrR family transcriptional regulator [Myxococcales bacterium]
MARSAEQTHEKADARRVRGRIIQAAAEVFAREGPTATSVEDLLRAAGVSRRTFYKYFRGKEDALRALFRVATSAMMNAIRGGLEADGDADAKLTGAVDAYLRIHCVQPALASMLIAEAIRTDSLLGPGREAVIDSAIKLYVEELSAAGGPPLDPLVVRGVILATEGLCIQLLAAPNPTAREIERVRAAILTITRRALDITGGAPGR